MPEILESDWKRFKELHPLAMDRYCQRLTGQMERIMADTRLTSHERFLEMAEFCRRERKELADLFDEYRRSTATICLMHFITQKLLTFEEVQRLSPEFRSRVEGFVDLPKRPSHE